MSSAFALALMGIIFYLKNDAVWLVSTTAIVFLIFSILIGYRMFKQSKVPIITTTEEGILVHIYGFNKKYIKWDLVTDMEKRRFSINLDVVGKREKIPFGALSKGDKDTLLNEIMARTSN